MEDMKMLGKKKALEAMRAKAMGEMKGGLEGALKESPMKKVTVASPDKEGLEEGLEKAKELVDKVPMNGEDEQEMEESPAEEMKELEEKAKMMSPEELDKLIKMLEEQKMSKM